MGEIVQKILPIKLQLDSSPELVDAFNALILKNCRADININAQFNSQGSTLIQGGNAGSITPQQSNELLCNIPLPDEGINICIGAYKSTVTKEIYWEVWNSEGNDTLWVSSSETNECRKVYHGECLNFQFPSQYHLPDHRCTLFVIYDQDDNGEKVIKSKFYVFTDGYNWQRFINVEVSIATDSFNPLLYPYFTTFYPYCDPCEFIQLGARPLDCPKVLPFDDTTQLQFYETPPPANNLKEKVWYFRIKSYFTDGRSPVLSPISTPVFLDGGDCSANAEDLQCFKLVLDAGSALVERIEVYYSNDGINWFKYDTIEKWDNCMSPQPENFWERDLALKNYYAPNSNSPTCTETGCFSTFSYTWDLTQSPYIDFTSATIRIDGVDYTNNSIGGLSPIVGIVSWLNTLNKGTFTFNEQIISSSSAQFVYGDITINNSPAETFTPTIEEVQQCGTANTFIYQFCGNKGCEPVDPSEALRVFDELPITSVAQTTIDNQIAFGNNLTGYDNFICPIENIEIEAVQDSNVCETELVTIIIDAIIQNFYHNTNTIVYKLANSTNIAFGGLSFDIGSATLYFENEVISSYQQQIVNGKGFIGSLRGTEFKAYSQQYRVLDLDTPVIPDNVDYNNQTKSLMLDVVTINYAIQRLVFKVPKGNYIFEMQSHLATLNNGNGTSTYFLGTTPKASYNPHGVIGVNENVRELLINACDGDVTLSDYVVIADLTKPKTSISVSSDARAVCGYLKEKETNIPVELAHLNINETVTVKSSGTDANGFYFATDDDQYIIHLDVLDPSTCTLVEAHDGGDTISNKQLNQIDLVVDNPTDGMAFNEFNDCAHELVEGTVTDCNGNPIAGIPVMLTRTGKYAITDVNGQYTILAHDDANWFAQFGETRKIEDDDSLVISQTGVCVFATCGECNTCIPTQHVTFTNSCFHCTSQSPPTTGVDIYNFTLQIISGALTGVKTGGTFAIALIGYDEIDRNNQAQLAGYFTVPTIMSNGVFAPYHFNWAFTAPLNLPSWVKKLRWAVRPNDYEFKLSWAANKIEFIDTQGNITAPSVASNIKIYIDGLNTFILNNFTNTNAKYQFVEGDRIRFITKDGSEPYLEADNNGVIDLPVSSLVDGNALLIPFDSRLTDLEANATFELYRVPVCTTEPIYLEQCPTIPVIDGEPTITSGTIPYFDTYWFFRAIPQTDKDGNPYTFISPHRYEHHSPSDFWGDHLASSGRPFARNPNARQTWLEDEIRYSLVLNENGVINGLSTFLSANAKNYFTPNCGGIVSLKSHTGLMFILYENYYDVISIAQNLLMVTAQGNVQANADYLGNRQQKIAIVYGCDLRDTSTIIYHDEWLSFIDVQRGAVCLSNYQRVNDITKRIEGISEGNTSSYWIEKLRYIASLRSNNQFDDPFMFLHSGYYPKKNEIVITSFARAGSPNEITYTNQERDDDIYVAETVSFNLSGYWSGQYSFTPERFIDFDSGANGTQLIMFKQGQPYISDRMISSGITYNNFFGEQCEPVIKFIFNGGEGKNQTQKRFLAMRILCKQSLWFSDEIWTQAQQNSQLPIEEFQMVENFSEAGFLCDILTASPNGASALVDGDSLSSSWIKIRILIDPDNKNKYFELEGIIVNSTESY